MKVVNGMEINRTCIKLIGEYTKEIYKGSKSSLLLFHDENIGDIAIGVSNYLKCEFGKRYEIVVSVTGKTISKDEVKIYSNRLTMVNCVAIDINQKRA